MFFFLPIGVEGNEVRVPLVCLGIVALCVLAFFGTWVLPSTPATLFHYALIPAHGFKQIGFLTHMFLHAGWIHLLGNLLFFYLCGPLLEDTWGRKLFAAFYLTGGLVAATAHFLIDRSSAVPMVGASGAIAACMGAFAIRFASRRVAILYVIFLGFKVHRGIWRWPAWVCGLLWFGSEALTALFTGGNAQGVAVMAHVGGFAFGATVAFGMRALGLEKQFVALSEEATGAIAPSVLKEVADGHRLLQAGNLDGARARFEAGLKTAADDVDAGIALVKLDLGANEKARAHARLEPLLGRLLRGKEEERAIALLWEVWPSMKVDELKPAFAFTLGRAAEAVGDQGQGLVAVLYGRGGAAAGLTGAKSLLRAAELALKTTEPHLAAKHLDTLLGRPDAGPELLERARALRGTVPAAPVAAAAMASGLELDLVSRAQRPVPSVVSCVLLAVTEAGLTLQSSTGDQNALPFAKVLAVAAGVVPVTAPGVAVRGMLLVDLIMAWGDAKSAAVAVRLDSDTTVMSKLFPGATAAQVYGAFFTQLLEASGATAITPAADLKSGNFPRYPSNAARDQAVFSPT